MLQKIRAALSNYWGYDSFLPLQREAMDAVCNGRDSIVVLPTGGGKSLCFQVPAVTMPGLTIVVSPLISLMKDQVDALTDCGIAAMRIDSSMSPDERDNVISRINDRSLKLLYLSPERLLSDGFIDFLKKSQVSFIAIDEAHCVSMWGHDFRPEYRQLGGLKNIFPDITIAAYTATATEQVRKDIALQLKLKQPETLVGLFDRPNLVYKVRTRRSILNQVCAVIDRYKHESGVVYCIRRKDVDSLCAGLSAKGYSVAPYHAGMSDQDRKTNQELFINEKVNTIVATIAFGMGIDKSNVRYVVHTGMPKSLENYQQESGRAGRDRLEAECCLFYSPGDYGIWKGLMRDMPEHAQEIAMTKLNGIYSYCTGAICRHREISRYFGQDLEKDSCDACDVCLGELKCIKDAMVTAQKILSCIIRLEQRFGAAYTALVLTGSRDHRILDNQHDQLSTYALLSDYSKQIVHDWIEQLTAQGYIAKTGEYNVLSVTPKGWTVLKGNATPRLLQPKRKDSPELKLSKAAKDSWDGVDRGLFEALRAVRSRIAAEKSIPAYIVFGDAALRDMARRKPANLDEFLQVKGVGQAKCEQYGRTILDAIKNYHTNKNSNPHT
ncbi:MAG: DNA helicase RecQ [Sedimentisphaerales bacterium]|nr:DNA helicase RecQ [Sedimentisphaerales bacterium]